MQSVEKDLAASAGKKKGPEAALSRTFKRLVQTAEDERRSGQAPSSLLYGTHGSHMMEELSGTATSRLVIAMLLRQPFPRLLNVHNANFLLLKPSLLL